MKRISILLFLIFMGTGMVFSSGQSDDGNSAESVPLSYMTWDYADKMGSIDALIENVDDQFGIEIDLMNIPTDQYETTFKTKLVADDLPDLVQVHDITKNYMVYRSKMDSELFVDISDLSSVSEYIPSVVESARKEGGELYYVPISTNVLGAIYNKDLFASNNLSIPLNIDELEILLDTLKSSGIVPIAAGFKDAWSTQIIPFIAYAQYINTYDMEIRKKMADGTMIYEDIKDKFTRVLNIQQQYAEKGYFQNDYLGTDINVASAMVGTGKAAMLVCGTWQYKAVQDANPDANIGYFAFPLNSADEKTVSPTVAAGGLCISSSSSNVEEAMKVMNYNLSAENQTRVIGELNGISTNLKVKVNNSFINEVSDVLGKTDVQPDFWATAGYYHPSATTFDLPTQFQALLANEITVDEFISEYDRLNAKALKK